MFKYVQLMRPKQWAKNVFVFLPAFFSLQIFHFDQFAKVCIVFCALSLASSAVYAFNDTIDREADRHHPRKKNRPVASGSVTPMNALVFSLFLLASSLVIAGFINIRLQIIIAAFLILNVLYSIAFKKIPYLDICSIAFGFVLRMLAGAAAIEVKTSIFLFATVFFLSLFMAAGKRWQELKEVFDSARHVLGRYNLKAVKVIGVVSMVLCCVLYASWVFVTFARGQFLSIIFASIPIVVLGFYAYGACLLRGPYGDPTEIIFASRKLQLILIAYVFVMGYSIVMR